MRPLFHGTLGNPGLSSNLVLPITDTPLPLMSIGCILNKAHLRCALGSIEHQRARSAPLLMSFYCPHIQSRLLVVSVLRASCSPLVGLAAP